MVAVTTVIVSFFAIFSDLGIAPAIVQKKELTHDDLSRIFTFTLLSGGVVTGVFFLLSGAVAAYYDAPVLRTICRILCVNLLFAALNIVPGALLYKERRFRFIALRTLAVQFTAGAAAVAAAFAGAGVYALTVTPVVSSVVLFAVNYRQHPLSLRLPDKGSLGKVFSFSAYQFFFNILNYFTRNLDKLLIGRYMGLTPLGYYEKSYRLMCSLCNSSPTPSRRSCTPSFRTSATTARPSRPTTCGWCGCWRSSGSRWPRSSFSRRPS